MTRDEVKGLFKRIKSNYPSFIFDEYKLTEWCNELKDYDELDVHKKLEEHMRSETYGNQEPRLYFLTKYLTKSKNKNNNTVYDVKCSLCGIDIRSDEYDKHFGRCSSVDYIVRQIQKYNIETSITKEMMYEMEDERFDKFYDKLMEIVYKHTTDERERKLLAKILYNQDVEISELFD